MKYLIHADGALPNLALMRLAGYFRSQGEEVRLVRGRARELWDPPGDVYGSSIFGFSVQKRAQIEATWGPVRWGGTGVRLESNLSEIDPSVDWETVPPDYADYPDFKPSIGFTQRGCRLSCKFCLIPGTQIITGEGLRAIEDVKIGDYVLTHLGKYRQVSEVMSRPYEGEILRMDSGALSRAFPTWLTPEHPVWTRHISYRSGGQALTSSKWIEAGLLQEKSRHRSRETYAFPRTKEEVLPHDGHMPGASWLAITTELMTLIGWYIAEGYLSRTVKRGHYQVTFCLGHSARELAFAKEIVKCAAAIGIRAVIYHPKIGIRVSVYHVKLVRWLFEHFGCGASTKRIPLWTRLLPKELLEPMVRAWANGDGHYLIRKGSDTWRVASVSQNLVVGLYEICLKLGFQAQINKIKKTTHIQGRAVNCKQGYTVSFHRPPVRKNSVVGDASHIYRGVKASERLQYSGPVFNLEVQEDNSYCTPGFAVHNCVVPKKEGKPKSVHMIHDIWRGPGHPKKIVLLDNDFFGQPRESWKALINEIFAGDFRVCFSQGINLRQVDESSARALAGIQYRDNKFQERRLYTAWDNIGDEEIFKRGVQVLRDAGVPPKHLMVYMLIGFKKGETWEEILYRFNELVALGCDPYPMVYNNERKDLKAFQRWAVTHLYKSVPWEKYKDRRLGTGSGRGMSIAEGTA